MIGVKSIPVEFRVEMVGEGDGERWICGCCEGFDGEGNFPLPRTLYAKHTSTIKFTRIEHRRRWFGSMFPLGDEKVDEEIFCRFSVMAIVDSQKYEKITYKILL